MHQILLAGRSAAAARPTLRGAALAVMGALALGCSGKTHSNESVPASKMDGETAPVPECQDYARALRTCLAQTGVPAADALATAESNARAPITLSSSELAAQAAGCVRARQQLATACR